MRDGDGCIRFLLLMLSSGVMLGCSVKPADTFTLRTDMPANFRLNALASYAPATGETCTIQKGSFTKKMFNGEMQDIVHLVDFKIPLTSAADGCELMLKSLKLDIKGSYGQDWTDIGIDNAWITILDRQANDTQMDSTADHQLFNGQCQWLFRTVGPNRYIAKILKCRAEDEGGKVLSRLAGGILKRDQLAGKTINISFKVAADEEPYYGRSWVKTSVGWKACTGRWGSANEEFCTIPPQFMDFKMPDGKPCSTYPSCND